MTLQWFKRFKSVRLIWKLTIFSVLFIGINLGALRYFGAQAAEHGTAVPTNRQEQVAEPRSGTPSRNAVAGIAASQPSQGVIYAPRDVVDMSRLVLEVSRDNTSHLAHYIELATTVIVVFFTVLGALGAAFGLHKIDDMDKKVEAWEKEYRDKMDSSAASLRREFVAQNELMTAKLEIDAALRESTPESINGGLRKGISRIKAALAENAVPPLARIRGLADLAFASKRLVEHEDAFNYVKQALDLARQHGDPKAVALLSYNAACYAALLKKRVECLESLEEAIQLDAIYKKSAIDDKDFDWLTPDPGFQELMK